MKKYIFTVTEADIRFEIETAVSELEQEGQIAFPDGEARTEFIEDCVLSEIDRYELFDSDPFGRRMAYTLEALDMAGLYGYQL